MAECIIGRRAPSFSLAAVNGTGGNQATVTLDDYQDRWLMVMFYPRDFSMI